ncbi:hypothetical protein AMTRI_Chr01g137370 [Amborella trichopoda]
MPHCLFSLLSHAMLGLSQLCHRCHSRKCRKPDCRGLKESIEFDLRLQGEEKMKLSLSIDGLPMKGGAQLRADYDFLQYELKKMVPPNGKAVLLCRAPYGCLFQSWRLSQVYEPIRGSSYSHLPHQFRTAQSMS